MLGGQYSATMDERSRAAGRFDAVVCDIDGCLVDEGGGAFDLDALAQIAAHNRRARERGDVPVVTLCTGRPQPFAEAISRLIGNAGAGAVPLVAENGAWVYDPSKNEYALDPAITKDDRAMVRAAAAWLEDEFGPLGVSQQPGKAASVSLYHPEPEVLKRISPTIEGEFARRGWGMRVSMTWFYINCDLKHISKGTGLERLMQRTGWTRERLAGVGDTMSDLAIRERVGWFACPANAAEGLTQRADYVARASEARGVVEILRAASATAG